MENIDLSDLFKSSHLKILNWKLPFLFHILIADFKTFSKYYNIIKYFLIKYSKLWGSKQIKVKSITISLKAIKFKTERG